MGRDPGEVEFVVRGDQIHIKLKVPHQDGLNWETLNGLVVEFEILTEKSYRI